MSKANDIITAIHTRFDSGKSFIKVVDQKYILFSEMEQLATQVANQFPRAVVMLNGSEVPIDSSTLGTEINYLLPVAVDLWIVKETDLRADRESAIQEARDIIELPANDKWGIADVVQTNEITNIDRNIIYNTEVRNPQVVFGFARLEFTVRYKYTKGDS